MKFKTKRNSKTGKKFTEISKIAKECKAAAIVLVDEVGAKEWRGTHNAFGGISSFRFDDDYVAPNWMRWVSKNEYKPLRNRKEGKALQAKMDALPVVTRRQLNMCIGYDEIFSCIGYNSTNEDYFLFEIDESYDVIPPADCVEITVTEYNKLAE